MGDTPMDPEFERLATEFWFSHTVTNSEQDGNEFKRAHAERLAALWRWHCEQVERGRKEARDD